MKTVFDPSPAVARINPPRRRVLAIVGNTQVGLWVVRCLGRAGLTVYAVCTAESGLAVHSRFADGAYLLEVGASDPRFVDEVEALARRLEVGSILTIAEGYHAALIPARERFEPDIHVFSPGADSFAKATDKDYMQQLCTELGVPVARGTTLDRFIGGDGKLRYPLVLRTRQLNVDDDRRRAPFKAAYATNEAELEALHRRVADIADNVLVQEYHPGVEDHVQILMHQGEPFMVGEYIGEHHMPLAGGVTVQRVSCRHEPLIKDAVRLLQALGWQGIAGVQFHYDPATDRYIFLEINPRFIGGLPTVIMAGFDAPLLLWQSHFEPERMQRTAYRLGLRTRILGGDANWMLGMFRHDELPPDQQHLGKCAAAARFLWNCGPWTKDDVFWIRDPKPFWVDFKNMLGRLGGQKFDIIGNPTN